MVFTQQWSPQAALKQNKPTLVLWGDRGTERAPLTNKYQTKKIQNYIKI